MASRSKSDVCPVTAGYLLICPVRRIIHDPEKILSPYIKEGMTLLDVGPGMGYFTIPMARLAGERGLVIAVDIQKEMLEKLRMRALHRGVAERIELIQADENSLNLSSYRERIDFALAFAVVHESPDAGRLFRDIYSAMKKGGRLLFVEPIGHVSRKKFEDSLKAAEIAGFILSGRPSVFLSHSALLIRSGDE